MLNVNEYVTTTEKRPYPWHGQIQEIFKKDGIQYFRCIMVDMSEPSRKIYTKNEIRHYSAKEFADDIFSYYTGEKAGGIVVKAMKEGK